MSYAPVNVARALLIANKGLASVERYRAQKRAETLGFRIWKRNRWRRLFPICRLWSPKLDEKSAYLLGTGFGTPTNWFETAMWSDEQALLAVKCLAKNSDSDFVYISDKHMEYLDKYDGLSSHK